ncbi:peptidoglycan recognition protein family protein [Streptomyces litchfieldiae]|uniref:Peptidoglycan recognition family protein n=1 Tax=Streptomyces litchfieldiae TaxID=3075543 RepID=A0ABU2MPR5_9ACTN|nr:peptidoglycan recognition family protein [Streptomyces sp. DSM 44938]MDT0343079.1 peptidoglycan recognition family protein [Streptomyces sp. DSM 44938]
MLLTGAAGLAAATALPATARAADVIEPDIDGTTAWGARPPSGNITILRNRPNKIIIHHTVSTNTSNFSRAQAHSHARWVQALHMDDNGWIDTGYLFVNSRGGWLTEGRHRSLETLLGGTSFVLGAHTSGQNYEGIGIANEGAYHDGALPPQAQWDVLVQLCAFICQQYGIRPTEIYGHKDFGNTLCPGVLHDMLPDLRSEVSQALGR